MPIILDHTFWKTSLNYFLKSRFKLIIFINKEEIGTFSLRILILFEIEINKKFCHKLNFI